MIELDKGVFVDPKDVASIEDHAYWNNSCPSDGYIESYGCRIILRNGLKLYLKTISAIDAHDKMFPPLKDVVPSPNSPRAILINHKSEL